MPKRVNYVLGKVAGLSLVSAEVNPSWNGENAYWKRVYKAAIGPIPLSNLPVKLIDADTGEVIDEKTTDDNGMVEFSMNVYDPGKKKYIVTVLEQGSSIDPLFTDRFTVSVWEVLVTATKGGPGPDCYKRKLGRTINIDPIKYNEDYGQKWYEDPYNVAGEVNPDDENSFKDIVPVMSDLSLTAYYAVNSPHWTWKLTITATNNVNGVTKSGITGNECREVMPYCRPGYSTPPGGGGTGGGGGGNAPPGGGGGGGGGCYGPSCHYYIENVGEGVLISTLDIIQGQYVHTAGYAMPGEPCAPIWCHQDESQYAKYVKVEFSTDNVRIRQYNRKGEKCSSD